MSEPRAQRQVAPAHLPRSGELRSTGTPGFGPADPFIAFAHSVLRREAAALAANKPQNEQAPTPDEIHQLRVAARRLRVALRLFGRMLPSKDGARFNAELRWFAGSLGDIRDLDVYTDNFKAYVQGVPPEQQAASGYARMYLRRERCRKRGNARLRSREPARTALLADIERFGTAGPERRRLTQVGSLTVSDAMRQSVRRSVGRVRASAHLTTRAHGRAPRAAHQSRSACVTSSSSSQKSIRR
jgi:CHAD domain-containing protein